MCSRCGPIGEGWTAEQTATELAFAHARSHVEPEQLTILEVELVGGPRRRRRRAV